MLSKQSYDRKMVNDSTNLYNGNFGNTFGSKKHTKNSEDIAS